MADEFRDGIWFFAQMNDQRKNVMDSVQEHLKHVIVPILYDYGEKGHDQLGCACLVGSKTRLFLLSALHTFQGLEIERFLIPANYNAGEDLLKLWPCDIRSDTQHDLVAFDLNPETAERARAGWRITEMASCGVASTDAQFVISGFPSCRLKRPSSDDRRLGGSLITSYLERLPDIPQEARQPVDPDIDIFFFYAEEGKLANGEPFKSPNLKGVSGAPIWELDLPGGNNRRLWTPQNALKLVGIETDALHFRHVRGKQWRTASRLLE